MNHIVTAATADLYAVSNEDLARAPNQAPPSAYVAIKKAWRRTGPGRLRGQLGYSLRYRWARIR